MSFNFTAAITRVCGDMTQRVTALGHIDMGLVAVGFRQARAKGTHGVHASLTPLRFENGAERKKMRGRWYACPRLTGADGAERLYLLQFYLPRFLDVPLEEKLTTIVHELWHIGPAMDGDLRRLEGRCYAHGHSQKAYDAHAARLAREWLAADPPAGLYAFLEGSLADLIGEHGGVTGTKFTVPKLAPIAA